jgi:hypothetical protein
MKRPLMIKNTYEIKIFHDIIYIALLFFTTADIQKSEPKV